MLHSEGEGKKGIFMCDQFGLSAYVVKIIEFDMFANTMNVISVSLRMMAEHLFLLLYKLQRISDFCPLSWNRLSCFC